MSSLARMLAILDLFSGETPSWTVEAIAQHMGYTVPTAYRYVRELCDTGLLRREGGPQVVLGPRAIELDYQIRLADPLLNAGRDELRELAQEAGCDVVLATECGGRIVTIHHEFGSEDCHPSYGRGRRMPLFRGATSKCLLAHLPRPQLRKLYQANLAEAQASDFSRDWDALLAGLRDIRRQGYATTAGELDSFLAGIAAPLLCPSRHIVASLAFVMSRKRFGLIDVSRSVARLQQCADAVASRLATASPS